MGKRAEIMADGKVLNNYKCGYLPVVVLVSFALLFGCATPSSAATEESSSYPVSFSVNSIAPESDLYSSLFSTVEPPVYGGTPNDFLTITNNQVGGDDAYRPGDYFWAFWNGEIQAYDIQSNGTSSSTIIPFAVFPSPSQCRNSRIVDTGTDIAFVVHPREPGCEPTAVLEVSDGGSVTTSYVLGKNLAIDVRDVPPITAGAGVASPFDACLQLDNSEEVEGNYCITVRGNCSYATKYQNCVDAGAVAVLVVNDEDFDSTSTGGAPNIIPQPSNPRGTLFTSLSKSDGTELVNLIASSNGIVELSAGKGIYRERDFSSDALEVFDWGSMSKVDVETAPFEFVEESAYLKDESLLYILESHSTGVLHVLETSGVEVNGSYFELGSFTLGEIFFITGLSSIDTSGGSLLTISSAEEFECCLSDTLTLYDIATDKGEDPTAPVEIKSFPQNSTKPGCQEALISNYIYHKGLIFAIVFKDGYFSGPTDYTRDDIIIFDLESDFIGYANISETRPYGYQSNNPVQTITFGEGAFEDLALVKLKYGDFVFYDFGDALNPTVASQLYRAADNLEDLQYISGLYDGEGEVYDVLYTYAVGALSSAFGGADEDGKKATFFTEVLSASEGQVSIKEVTATLKNQ